MSKHSATKDREDKARRRLVKAQIELQAAQEKRGEAISRAEREVERAKNQGNKWVLKATERVERRAGAIARAEAHLLTSTTPNISERPPGASSESVRSGRSAVADLSTSNPSAAADVLEQRVAEATEARDADPIVVPESVNSQAPQVLNGNEPGEENVHHPW